MSFRGYMLLFVGLACGGALLAQAQKEREQKRPVDIKANVANRYPEFEENAIVMTGDVVFHHNGTVISCDSAVRYSDRRIDCFKNVIINKDSTYIYGERAEYNGEVNLARVYSTVVKVVDGSATLYTYNFTFNTRDNIGIYYGGGVMYQDDNIMESEKGYYYSNLREMVAIHNVEMKNNDYTVISDSVRYNMDTKVAHFYTKAYIWTTEGEIITADKGRYNTQDSTYFFHGNAYVMTDFRETWADTIDFNSKRQDAQLYGNIQINDGEHTSSAFGDFGQYWGGRGETMLTKQPSMFNYSEEHNNNSDTLYMRADTIFMFVVYPSDKPTRGVEGVVDPHAHLKFADALSDSVRLVIADSLRPVISRLRTEADSLKHIADSIMSVLYPPQIEDIIAPQEEFVMEQTTTVIDDTLPPSTISEQDTVVEEAPSEAIPEEPVQETDLSSRKRKDRNRGPNPDFWRYSNTLTISGNTPPDNIPLVLSLDSLAAASLPPTEMVTDSLSHMEKVMELLPSELSGYDPSSLLEIVEDGVPKSMLHLVSDSVDVAALRSVIADATANASEYIQVPKTPETPETKEPEKVNPPEVEALRKRVEELTSRADSLQNAESYIRPKLQLGGADTTPLDSLALVAVADSLARLDSIGVADSLSHLDKKALKKFEKAERHRLKTERKIAKKAEKLRLKEEKRAAKEAKQVKKEAEWRRRLIAKGRLTDTLSTDSLSRIDSLALLDSLLTTQIDSLGMVPPEEQVSEQDTTERIFRGWFNVRIWRNDMQAVCDSMVGFSRDSTIRMYTDPIMWHGESQIVSDSLILHTAGDAIDYIEFFGNPIMGSKIDGKQFNQVTGRTMTSRFRNNDIYRHDIYGNAQAYYFIQEDDDPTPVAFIVATSSNMSFLMEKQFVSYIIAREQVEWPVYPVDHIPPGQPKELKGFKWHKERQPELKDVFDRMIRPSEREFHEMLEFPKFPIAARINRRREYLIENRMWADRIDPLPAHAVEFVASLDND